MKALNKSQYKQKVENKQMKMEWFSFIATAKQSVYKKYNQMWVNRIFMLKYFKKVNLLEDIWFELWAGKTTHNHSLSQFTGK